jgi:hypothetical protein
MLGRAGACPGLAAPRGGPWSFYIFTGIFWPCASSLPLGGEGGPPPAFSSAGAGRVRWWWAYAGPFAVHIAPLKALGNDHATSSALSRNLGTALRCLWFEGIDPLTPRPLSPKGERGECRNSSGRPRGGAIFQLGHYADSVCIDRGIVIG